jgi:hypothetical protein
MPPSPARSALALATFLVCALAARAGAGGSATFLGPSAYLSQADSPFPLGTGTFCLEDFEDGVLTPATVVGNGSVVPPGGLTDSVDGDDGAIDGSGTQGTSYFSGDGAGGITFTFDPGAPLGLPTAAGIVWTDGGFGDTVTFEAFGPGGESLGTVAAPGQADGSNTGETAEDAFFGVTNAAGISAINVRNQTGGIEVDHLQLDHCMAASETTTTTTSTTTTTLAGGCDGVPSGPIFASLDCRLAALRAGVEASAALGGLQAKLVKAVARARDRNAAAEAACTRGDARAARKRLRQAVRKLIQLAHRLRSNAARKKVPAAVREPFAAEADAIKIDAQALMRSLACGTA